MAEKLSASRWPPLARKHKLDEPALAKALVAFDKSDAARPGPRLEALGDVIEQARKAIASLAKRKKELGDKVFGEAKDALYEMLDAAEALQKDTRAVADAAAAEAETDDEADTPALLTSKMVPLLRELRKGQARMHALVCTAGKNTAVLIMRRAISASRRKLLAEAVDAKGGAKYIVAECLLENNALTFVVQSAAGGLAKRINQALRTQTGLRQKVKVRGSDGVEDEDGDDDVEDPSVAGDVAGNVAGTVADAVAGGPLAPAASAGATGTEAAVAGPAGSGTRSPVPPSPERLAFMQRFRKVGGSVAQALAGQHPEATKLRALLGYAHESAEGQKDLASGTKALVMIEAVLAAAPAARSAPGAPVGQRGTVMPSIIYTQTRLAWVGTRGRVATELKKLEDAILDSYRDQPVLPEVVQSVRRLDGVLAMFDESLVDRLDAALTATDPAEKQRAHDEAREVIARYQAYLATDPLVQELDGNPFVPITVQATLSKTLATLAAKIV